MNEPLEVLTEPVRLLGGKGVARVVAKGDNAVPEIWSGSEWEEVDGSYLAYVLEGTSLSAAALDELGIRSRNEIEVLDKLDARFPATRFVVNSEADPAGRSLTIHWTDGPTKRLVREVIQSSDAVFLERELSKRFVERIEKQLDAFFGSGRPDDWHSVIRQAAEDATAFAYS